MLKAAFCKISINRSCFFFTVSKLFYSAGTYNSLTYFLCYRTNSRCICTVCNNVVNALCFKYFFVKPGFSISTFTENKGVGVSLQRSSQAFFMIRSIYVHISIYITLSRSKHFIYWLSITHL